MNFICQLLNPTMNQTRGICQEKIFHTKLPTTTTTASSGLNNKINSSIKFDSIFKHNLNSNLNFFYLFRCLSFIQFLLLLLLYFQDQMMSDKSETNPEEAAMFIVIVICFYSLSIACMVIINIKLKLVFARKPGQFCCCQSETISNQDDQDEEETRKTIHLMFSNTSKIAASIIIPEEYLKTTVISINKSQNNNLNFKNNVENV
jgi:hypothetical protein